MADLFAPIIQQLQNLGFFGFFFPWIITLAIFYAILKKSKILGDSAVLNGAIALAIAFLVGGFSVMTGGSLGISFTNLFTQTTTMLLFLIVAFIAASMFYPDLPKMLAAQFTHRTTLWAMLALGVTLLLTSGLIGVFFNQLTSPSAPGATGIPTDVLIIAAGVILFVVILLIASSVGRMGQ